MKCHRMTRFWLMKKSKCEGCKWHDDFTWACCNGDSSYVADFVNCGCEKYDRREDRSNADADSSRK